MAAAFIYFLILLVLSQFLLVLSPSSGHVEQDIESNAFLDHIDDSNDADTRAGAVISPSSEPVISPWMYNVHMVLLWSRDSRCSRPFKPKPQRSFKSCVVAILLLMCGDVESNPGPPATRPSGNLRVGHINPWSCVNKTELILSTIDEQRLDVLAITESYIREDLPVTIKNDPAPRGSVSPTSHERLRRAVALR